MKKVVGIFLAASAWMPAALWGGGVQNSTAPLTVPAISTPSLTAVTASTAPPTVAEAGETISLPAPTAMTESKPLFVTLTRTPLPAQGLPNNVSVVTPREFAAFDAQNAGEAVQYATSVQSPRGGDLSTPSMARIRGGSSHETLVLVDGRPIEGFSLGAADLSEIPSEQIDHIEIVRGGFSALYGPNAVDGVINVITKRAQYAGMPISHVGYETGSYGRQGFTLDVGSRAGPLDYYLYGDNKWISGFRSSSDDRQYNVGGNLGLSLGKAGKILLDASGYHTNAGVPGPNCGPDDTFCLSGQPLAPNAFNNKDEKPASTPDARRIVDTNYIRTSYLLPLPDSSLLTVRAFGTQREVQFNDANDPNPLNAADTDRHEQSRGSEAQLALPYGLLFGGNFLHDREDNTDLLTPSNTFIRSADNWGIFGQDTFRYDVLTIIPSGRFDHNSLAGDSSSPRVQAMIDARDWLQFSGSAGHSFRPPMLDELFLMNSSFTGNPNLLPEKAWTYDSGFELHEDSASFKATYFRANISNLIQDAQSDPNNLNSPLEAVNIGTARRQGAEIEITHVVNRYFRDTWNYTYLRNTGIPEEFNHDVSLAFSPRHTVNYIATINPALKWTINVTARYVDSEYSGNNQTGTKLGSELLPGFRIAYQWRQMELYFGVSDLTNKRYVEEPGFPLPGATAYGGITLRLWG